MKHCFKWYKGFTLMELMISIAIVGILASIAYPSYVNYIDRSRRADALATLSQMQLILERCYSQNFSYSAACTGRPTFPLNSPQNFYTITLTNLSPTTYTLTATTRGIQVRDTTCTTMSVNQANVRTATNPECWSR